MAILKCKMCGGDLDLVPGSSVAECEFCGSVQTVPAVDDEKKLTLFGRANRLRAACEFDKAAGIYENIVADFPEEAEAYWGLVLCKYGIEYVDDPATARKIPTCHRSSFDSVMEDSDFEQVLENADGKARRVYREEAKQIEEIRKGIIAVSANEEPYDIFICYKETDENGDRTLDSVLAQDVYDALTDKGYRIFFSRITLEDKLGVEYEPYIFAALNSAKIMLVFGTDYEYFNAVWVKNEWSRYLKLMARDKEKHLIPCFKGIDAYDMPKEFARLQAQDLGKVGATQDLLRGIEKILPRKQEQAPAAQTGVTASALVMRGQFALDDGAWQKADEYFERALDQNPQDAEAYFGKVLVKYRKRTTQELEDADVDLVGNKNLDRAIAFSTGARKQELEALKQKYTVKKLALELVTCLRKIHKKAETKAIMQEAQDLWDKAQGLFAEGTPEAYDQGVAIFEDGKNRGLSRVLFSEEKVCMHRRRAAIIRYLWNVDTFRPTEEVRVQTDRSVSADTFSEDLQNMASQGIVYLSSLHGELYAGSKNAEAARLRALEARKAARGSRIFELEACRNRIAKVQNKYLASGTWHTVGLRADGTVVAVGGNQQGQCNVEHWKNIVAVASGAYHTVGLKSDGTVVATKIINSRYTNWDYGQSDVDTWRNIVAIAAGDMHTVGLRADGTVIAVGENMNFQCDVADWTGITAVFAGPFETVGLRADGTCLTSNGYTYPWENIVAAASGVVQHVGLCADGSLVSNGSGGEYCEGDVEAWEDVIALAAAQQHTVVLLDDGTVDACGSNAHGQCDVGHWENVVAIAASEYHTVGLTADGVILSTQFRGDGYNANELKAKSNIPAVKLFHNVDTIEQERIQAIERAEQERLRREEEARLAKIREEEARERAWQENQWRAAGVCRHCGGAFKGLFSKKCVRCGMQKDY